MNKWDILSLITIALGVILLTFSLIQLQGQVSGQEKEIQELKTKLLKREN